MSDPRHDMPGQSEAAVWKDSSLVQSYLADVRGSVPFAEAQIDVMMRVIEARGTGVESFLDVGCGDGVLAAAILTEYPNSEGVLIDFSQPMIDAAVKNLKAYSRRLHFVNGDYADPFWFELVAPRGPFDVAVSGFSIHHQPDVTKQQVYRDIYDLLQPGGVFVNMEHVASSTRWVERMYDELFIDTIWMNQVGAVNAKDRAAVAEEYQNRVDREANILADVEAQCRWLRQIGFQDVDCYFKIFELAVFGGRKPLNGV